MISAYSYGKPARPRVKRRTTVKVTSLSQPATRPKRVVRNAFHKDAVRYKFPRQSMPKPGPVTVKVLH